MTPSSSLTLSVFPAIQLAFTILFTLVTLYQLVATIMLILRGAEGSTRAPFYTLSAGLGVLLSSYILQCICIAYTRNNSVDLPVGIYNVSVTALIFTDILSKFAVALLASAILHLIGNRRGYYGFKGGCLQIPCCWDSRYGFDALLVSVLALAGIVGVVMDSRVIGPDTATDNRIWAISRENVLAFQVLGPGNWVPIPGADEDKIQGAKMAQHFYVAACVVVAAAVVSSAVSLWLKISRVQTSPENGAVVILRFITPLYLLLMVYKITLDILFNIPLESTSPSFAQSFTANPPDPWLLATLCVEGFLTMAVVFAMLNAGTVVLTTNYSVYWDANGNENDVPSQQTVYSYGAGYPFPGPYQYPYPGIKAGSTNALLTNSGAPVMPTSMMGYPR